MSLSGFVSAGVQMGLGSLIVKPKRGIMGADGSSFIPQATIEERQTDDIEITDHPIEQGAVISDHFIKRPAEVIIKAAWSNSPSGSSSLVNSAVAAAASVSPVVGQAVNLYQQVSGAIGAAGSILSSISGQGTSQMNAIYNKLIATQANGVLCSVYTGRRVYQNMLIKSVSLENDNKTENALYLTITMRAVILVNTSVVTINNAANPALNAPTPSGVSSLSSSTPTYSPLP